MFDYPFKKVVRFLKEDINWINVIGILVTILFLTAMYITIGDR